MIGSIYKKCNKFQNAFGFILIVNLYNSSYVIVSFHKINFHTFQVIQNIFAKNDTPSGRMMFIGRIVE